MTSTVATVTTTSSLPPMPQTDAYSGDDGEDTLDYSTATMSITIDLGRGRAESHEIGMDLIAGFEKIIAGQGDDHIVAGSSSATLTGGDGDDTFEFGRSG